VVWQPFKTSGSRGEAAPAVPTRVPGVESRLISAACIHVRCAALKELGAGWGGWDVLSPLADPRQRPASVVPREQMAVADTNVGKTRRAGRFFCGFCVANRGSRQILHVKVRPES